MIRVDTAQAAVLLTGDIERLSEMNLRERRQPLAADVLVVPHHGSRDASSAAFLDAVQARHVLIPVGHRNRYGHPHAQALARYRERGAAIWRSDRDGAVTVRLEQTGIVVTRARAEQQRYWRAHTEIRISRD